MKEETIYFTLPASWKQWLIGGEPITNQTVGQIKMFLNRKHLPMPYHCGGERFSPSNDAYFKPGLVLDYAFRVLKHK